MSRILQGDMVDANKLAAILNEYLGLFAIMAEEDPGYRQIQILQDAGLIPLSVDH